MNKPNLSRRRFLGQAALAVPVGAVLVDAVLGTPARADQLPELTPDDPSAKALLYVADATKVDRKNPLAARYAPDQKCSTCSQIQGKAGDALRPCAIFPGKLVSANGWCSVWAKKT